MKINNMRLFLITIFTLIIALSALAFSLMRVIPFEITSDTYVGIIATFVGISVTLVIGFQIVNTLQIRNEIAEQRKNYEKVVQISVDLSKIIESQKNEMQEGFDILNTLVFYQENGWTYSIQAFSSLHHSLISSLNTNRTDYNWIFDLLRKYIADVNWQNFTSGFAKLNDGRYVITTDENHGLELKDIINRETGLIYQDEKLIRNDENFCRIQMEYDRVMRLFRKRIDEVITNPNTYLTQEEKYIITHPL